VDPNSQFVEMSSVQLSAMSLDEIKEFAKSLGLSLNHCESLGQARTALLGSAVGFENTN
jgi:hypothetical protein